MPSDCRCWRGADARDLQDVRRVDGAARHDHLAVGAHLGEVAAALEGDADAALALEQQLAALRLGLDAQVGPALGLAQKSLRRRAAQAAAPRHLRIADALALLAVEIGIEREARLLRGFDEAMGERQDGAVVLDLERPALAAHLGIAALHVVLGLLEVGQHVVVAPAAAAHLRPAVEVGRRAAHIEHAVDRARAAHDAPARPFHAALAGALLGLGRVVPVDQRVADQRAHAGRDMDHRMPVARAGLQQDHRRARFRQTRRDHASGRAGAHHDIVRPHAAALMAFLSRYRSTTSIGFPYQATNLEGWSNARSSGVLRDAAGPRRRSHLRQSRHHREPAARFAARLPATPVHRAPA